MAVTSIIILVTDGQENCFRGKISLPIGDGDADGDQEAEIDFGEVMDTKGVFSRDYLKHTATSVLECNAITVYTVRHTAVYAPGWHVCNYHSHSDTPSNA